MYEGMYVCMYVCVCVCVYVHGELFCCDLHDNVLYLCVFNTI